MKFIGLFIYLLFSFYFCSYAQISDAVFIGTVTLNGKGHNGYSYKLQVTDSNGILSGYSITDLRGPNETRTLVKGSIDEQKKVITFRETKIVYTKSSSAQEDFCFIHGKLKVGKMQGMATLKGPFTGYKQDGVTKCASGKLALVCAEDALNKLMKIAEKEKIQRPREDTAAKPEKKTEIVYEKEVPDADVQKVQPGKTAEFVCPAPATYLEVWDSKTIDGDEISITQDDVTILPPFVISGKRQHVDIDMGNKKSVTLRLTAINEGSEPLNTARIKIVSGSRVYYVDATTTIGKDVYFVLKNK